MEINGQPLVSIVTPVYNGEKYLPECIESILSQTYQKWEYIIVNNCSKDSSFEIASKYAEIDKRIRVHNNINFLTALQNFNHSLKLISPVSKYCKIVHADDWIFPDCIMQMVKLAEKNDKIGIVGSYRLVGTVVESTGLHYKINVIDGREMTRMNLLDGPYTFGSPSALLIRSDLIRAKEKFYNELHPGADTEVCCELLQDNDFGFVHQVLSYSRVHKISVSSSLTYINHRIANNFYSFMLFGPHVMSADEFNAAKKKRLRAYYRFLGSKIGRLADPAFRKYHAEWLERLGFPFCWPRVIGAAILLALIRAIDVKQHVKTLVGCLKRPEAWNCFINPPKKFQYWKRRI
jgi:glycosyltransferase involved in cell wall biosynthesis